MFLCLLSIDYLIVYNISTLIGDFKLVNFNSLFLFLFGFSISGVFVFTYLYIFAFTSGSVSVTENMCTYSSQTKYVDMQHKL